ncbi:MAG: hypothetical protein ACOC0P_02940 [Planctomycetota bacterium]
MADSDMLTGRLVTADGRSHTVPVVFLRVLDTTGRSTAQPSADLTDRPWRATMRSGSTTAALPWVEWPVAYARVVDRETLDGGAQWQGSAQRIVPFYLIEDPAEIAPSPGAFVWTIDGVDISVAVLGGLAAAFDPSHAWRSDPAQSHWASPIADHPLSCFRRMLLSLEEPSRGLTPDRLRRMSPNRMSPKQHPSGGVKPPRSRSAGDDEGVGEIIRAFGTDLALRWRLGLIRLERTSWGVAAALRETLTRQCFDGAIRFAAWPTNLDALAELESLLLSERLGSLVVTGTDTLPSGKGSAGSADGQREPANPGNWDHLSRAERDVVGRVLDWIESQPEFVAWVESDAGSHVHIAVANLTSEPLVAAIQWPGTDALPTGVFVDPRSVERARISRPFDSAPDRAGNRIPGEPRASRRTGGDEEITPGGGAEAALRSLRESGFLSGRRPQTEPESRDGAAPANNRDPGQPRPDWAVPIRMSPRPTEMLIDAGDGRTSRLLVAASAYPVSPPGAVMNRFVRSWTLNDWQGQATQVVYRDGTTQVTLQRSVIPLPATSADQAPASELQANGLSGWELFVECTISAPPAGSAIGSPPSSSSPVKRLPLQVDDLPGQEAVTIFVGNFPFPKVIATLGPEIPPRQIEAHSNINPTGVIRGSSESESRGSARSGPRNLLLSDATEIRSFEGEWRARIPIPSAWIEGDHIDLGIVRTHSGDPRRLESLPRTVLPWRIDPGRVRFDLSAWPSLPSVSSNDRGAGSN